MEKYVELLKDIYKITNSDDGDEIKKKILEWFNANNYCIECGSKMQKYEWSEQTENGTIWNSCWDCPKCGDLDIERR